MPEPVTTLRGPVFLCRVPARERCAFCPGEVVALCDHKKPGAKRTCSKRLCAQHRTRVGPNLDVCPEHRKAEAMTLGPLLHEAPKPAPVSVDEGNESQ